MSEAGIRAPAKRVGGGYHIPKRQGWVYTAPDLDSRPAFTAEQQARRIAALKQRLTKHDEGLLRACIAGDEMGAKMAMRNGARVNCLDETGQTPLIKAARHNNSAVVQHLLNNDADVNKGDQQGWTPLFWAARMGSFKCVKELMNPTDKNVKGCELSKNLLQRVKDVADTKVLKLLDEERKRRGQGGEITKEDAAAEDDDFPQKSSSKSKKPVRPTQMQRKGNARNVRKARKALLNAWGEHSEAPKLKTQRPKSAPVPLVSDAMPRRKSLFLKDPRDLTEKEKEQRLERMFTDASSSMRDFMLSEDDKKISGQSRLDQKKKDLTLREGLMRDMVRNSPDPAVYSLIWKYETHAARPFNDRVVFRNWFEIGGPSG